MTQISTIEDDEAITVPRPLRPKHLILVVDQDPESVSSILRDVQELLALDDIPCFYAEEDAEPPSPVTKRSYRPPPPAMG